MSAESSYKVKVSMGDVTVEIEGHKDGVVEIVSALTKVFESRSPKTPANPPGSGLNQMPSVTSGEGQPVDVRTFFEVKKPTSHVEAAVVAAFYLEHVAPIEQRRDTINAEFLKTLFIQANWKLPKVIGQVLVDTKKAGYLDGTSQGGEYRLNPVGFNLVAHTLGKEPSRRVRKRRKETKAKGRG